MRAPKDAPRCQLNTKPLNFKLWCVIPTGMLTCTAVMSGDDNQCCNAEQCKSPELDLRPVMYLISRQNLMSARYDKEHYQYNMSAINRHFVTCDRSEARTDEANV